MARRRAIVCFALMGGMQLARAPLLDCVGGRMLLVSVRRFARARTPLTQQPPDLGNPPIGGIRLFLRCKLDSFKARA